jgi:hypothetical protein
MYETEEFFPGSVDEKRLPVIDSLNAGFNHVVHIGHGFRFNMSVGDGSITNADADALVNGDRLSCYYLLNCTGVAYTYFCLAEHLMRNPNGGATSVVGANESAFPNTSSHYMNEYYELLFDQGVVHVGETFARSRLPRTPLALLSDNIDFWTHYIYTLLGDPEMPMWTRNPDPLAVTYPGAVNAGQNTIAVSVMSGGSPVEGATVCLTKGGDDYAVATTDAGGQAMVPFRSKSAGAIDVVVTGANVRRHQGTITVSTPAAYVKIDGITVDDDNLFGTQGNGNGVIEGGETVDLSIALRNTGTIATGAVTATLRSNDAAVTIGDSLMVVGVIAPSVTQAALDPVRVTFSETTGDAHPVPFTLVIQNNAVEAWRDAFKREVHQPILAKVTLRVDDSAFGNGNGFVEAGEQFLLFYEVKNFGTGTYPGGTAVLEDLDGAFTFLDSLDTFSSIAPLAQAENAGGFEMIEPSVATAHNLKLTLTDVYGRVYVDTFELRAPVAPTALAIDPSFGPDRLQVSWTKSTSPDAARYNVYRSSAPAGPYTLANVDPVGNAVFLNTALASNMLFYFQVTTIDVSGNESAPSLFTSGSTNPPQMGGFPITMGLEAASSPAVGDIDGDGDLEIVQTANKVYAWHADGIEVIDGDGDAQSWGVISNLGSSYTSHPALARIDSNPGLDIIAASRDTKQVYVFNYLGQVLPGWPRPVENFIRAGVVVGDMDGDNLFEIAAVDELGVIYVWNADGSEFIDGDSNPATQGVFYRMTGCTFNYSTPAMADMDADDDDELIVGSQGDQLFVFDGNGSIKPGFPYALGSDIGGSPVVGDVDNNGDMEIVVNEWIGSVRVINHDGTQLASNFFSNNPWSGPFFRGSPAIANVTGDGKLEIFVARGNGNLYAMQWNCTVLAGWPRVYSTTTYTESSPIVADIDGDAVLDVMIGEESGFIRAWNINGAPLAGFPLKIGDAVRAVPQLADIDQDGDIDLVAAGWDKNIYVWDFTGPWNPANAPWPRFQANTHNNGRLDFVVPTPVLSARFTYTARESGVELIWAISAEATGAFHVSRADLVDGVAGTFHRIASDVPVGLESTVRVVDRKVEMGAHYVYRLEGESGVLSESPVQVPVTRAKLGQNYPNPFNPVTRIDYWVPGAGKSEVSLVVYDVRGARVRTLVAGDRPAGRYTVEWDGRNDHGVAVSSGVYFYRMRAGGFADTHRMVLLK